MLGEQKSDSCIGAGMTCLECAEQFGKVHRVFVGLRQAICPRILTPDAAKLLHPASMALSRSKGQLRSDTRLRNSRSLALKTPSISMNAQ